MKSKIDAWSIMIKFVRMDSSLQKEVTAKMEVSSHTCSLSPVL